MKKKQLFIGSIILAVVLISGSGYAQDYSSMDTAELAALRGTMRDTTTDDRDAFRSEWQKRISEMSREEAREYRDRPANAIADGKGYKYNASNNRKGCRKMGNCSQTCYGTGSNKGTWGYGRCRGGQ